MDADAGGAPATVRLAFPPEARLLGTIRLVVGIVARKAGMGEEGIEDLKVAVSETCAVAVGDLSRAGLPDPIEVDLVEGADRFGIEVRDRAPAASAGPEGAAGGEVDDRELGLALVGALVDDLKTSTLEGGGNRTSFWLRRGPQELGPVPWRRPAAAPDLRRRQPFHGLPGSRARSYDPPNPRGLAGRPVPWAGTWDDAGPGPALDIFRSNRPGPRPGPRA